MAMAPAARSRTLDAALAELLVLLPPGMEIVVRQTGPVADPVRTSASRLIGILGVPTSHTGYWPLVEALVLLHQAGADGPLWEALYGDVARRCGLRSAMATQRVLTRAISACAEEDLRTVLPAGVRPSPSNVLRSCLVFLRDDLAQGEGI